MEKSNVMISIIWWYETMKQSGAVIGPLLLLSIHSINFSIFGGWKIDKFNLANLLLSLLYFFAMYLCHTKLCNVSKLYDQMMASRNTKQDSMDKPKVNANGRQVMKWSSLFQIDIISIVLLVSFARYGSTMSNLVVIATKFGWKSSYVYPISLISSIIFFSFLSIINRIGVLKGKPSNILFIFLSSVILMATNLNTLLLTDMFDTFNKQLAYITIFKLAQLTAWFLINALGNVLLFSFVDPEDSSFVTGFRGLMTSFAEVISHGLTFTSVYHPEYLVPWLVLLLIAMTWFVMYRRYKYL